MFDSTTLILTTLTVFAIAGIANHRRRRKDLRQEARDNDKRMKVWMEYNLRIDSSLDAEANFPDPVHASMREIDDYINKIDRLDVVLRYMDIAKNLRQKNAFFVTSKDKENTFILR